MTNEFEQKAKENNRIIQALKSLTNNDWSGKLTFDTLEKCLISINLYYQLNSGWFTPKPVNVKGLPGIYVINQNGLIFFDARIIKQAENQYKIENLTKEGYNKYESIY